MRDDQRTEIVATIKHIVRAVMSGQSLGHQSKAKAQFAFSPEEAQKAIQAMHGAQLGGRALTVNIARPREERSGGGGRGPRREYGGGGRRDYGGGRDRY